MLIAIIISHIWKLYRYNEDKQISATEKMVTTAWMDWLVKNGAMDELQETVSIFWYFIKIKFTETIFELFTLNIKQYECCGEKNSLDYVNFKIKIPLSCYRTQNGLRMITPYEEGCLEALKRAYLAVYRNERLAHSLFIGFEVSV